MSDTNAGNHRRPKGLTRGESPPVVHVNDRDIAVGQTRVTLPFWADGVYLISHGGGSAEVPDLLGTLRRNEPGAFIGVDLLDHSTDPPYVESTNLAGTPVFSPMPYGRTTSSA